MVSGLANASLKCKDHHKVFTPHAKCSPLDLRLSADPSIFLNGRKKKAETQDSGLTPEEHVVVVTDRKYGIVLPTCGALVGRLLGPVATVQRLRRNPLLLDE
jgi:hypothetical protein